MIANSPGDLERYVNCSAEKREQQYDLFKRHAASPLSALERSGGAYFQEKICPHPDTQVPVRSSRLRFGLPKDSVLCN